jgi:hypothetical protein
MICQTYDYFLEPTAAYFALKKGSESVHILWHPVNNLIQVANNTIHELNGLTAKAEIFDFNGKLVWEKSIVTDLIANSVTDCFIVDFPSQTTRIRFIKLTLRDQNNGIISENLYWSSSKYLDYKELNNLPEVKLKTSAKKSISKGKNAIEISLENPSPGMALMIRLKIIDSKTGERILPAFWSDNYFSLVPGEKRSVLITLENEPENEPLIVVEGWNIVPQNVKIQNQN